ncbi:MAG: SDR family NAD(P)-dependent oxidoreductase [Candidatus Nanoarchaeia archaeon]
MNKSNYALITGASSGIGFECSKYLAKKGYNLIIIARNKQKLKEMKSHLEKIYDIECIIIISDLTQKNAPSKIISYISKERLRIEVAILNAGFGDFAEFKHSMLSRQIEMIDLNITSLVELTHHLIPNLEQNKGYLLHVASVAAFQPLPYFANYSATKAYVLSFSQALRVELKGKVKVSTLCPGPTKTQFFKTAHAEQMIENDSNTMSAKDVAQIGIDSLFKNKALIIPGSSNKLMTFVSGFFSKSMQSTLGGKLLKPKK